MNERIFSWTDFFNKVASEVRKRIFEAYRPEADGSGPPGRFAIIESSKRFSLSYKDCRT